MFKKTRKAFKDAKEQALQASQSAVTGINSLRRIIIIIGSLLVGLNLLTLVCVLILVF